MKKQYHHHHDILQVIIAAELVMEELQKVVRVDPFCWEQSRTVGTHVLSDLLKDDS